MQIIYQYLGRFSRKSIFLFFLFFTLLATPFYSGLLNAQEVDSNQNQSEVTIELLAEALANDEVRDQLVDHLRALSQGENGARLAVEAERPLGAERPIPAQPAGDAMA